MPYIKVNTKMLSEIQEQVIQMKGRIDTIRRQFDTAGNQLDWEVKAKEEISDTIRQISGELVQEIDSLNAMDTFLGTAVRRYDRVNDSAVEVGAKIVFGGVRTRAKAIMAKYKVPAQVGKVIGSLLKLRHEMNGTKSSYVKLPETAKSAIEKAGYFGKAFSVVDNVAKLSQAVNEGKMPDAIKALTKGTQKAVKTINPIFKKAGKLKEAKQQQVDGAALKKWGKRFFGFDTYFDPKTVGIASKASSVRTRISENFGKALKKEVGKAKKADVVVSGIVNVCDNYSEYSEKVKAGEVSLGYGIARGVMETVGETGVDFAVTAALTAGTAAVLGATVGAPAVAVGVCVVGIKAGLDAGTKAITRMYGEEKGFTEKVSDGLLNFGEKAGEFINNKISNSASVKAARRVEGGVSSIIRNACSDKVNETINRANGIIGNIKSGASGLVSRVRLAF